MPDTETTPERGMTSADKEEEDTRKESNRQASYAETNIRNPGDQPMVDNCWSSTGKKGVAAADRQQRKKGRLKRKGRAPDVIP